MALYVRHAVLVEKHALIPIGKDAKDGYSIIDLEDVWVEKYKWCDGGTNGGYPCTDVKKERILLHRLILGAKKGEQVDHINHNVRDNRRSNLRICTTAQQSYNKRKRVDNTQLYKGVESLKWNKNPKYRARIRKNGKRVSLGVYETAKEAARAYDKAAKKLFGEFAEVNFGS